MSELDLDVAQDFLLDTDFLRKLDDMPIKVQYVKIVLLNFKEETVRDITGQCRSGSITINGSSETRRVLTLSMTVEESTNNLENIENLISLNKKVRVYVGYKNPFKSYSHYGDVCWFRCGMFVVTSASISATTSGCTVNITGRDKMCLLDGSIGGTLPSATCLSEIYEYDEDGNLFVEKPTMHQIVYELLTQFGEESPENIVINDLDDIGYKMVKYMGDSPMWVSDDYNQFILGESTTLEGFNNKFTYGEDVGYMPTDFVYPGELNMSAGDSVATAIGKIRDILGNHEFFYDLDGKFVFQEKKNYLNSSYSPVYELDGSSYVRPFTDTKYAYSLTSGKGITSITNSPSYENIKNDFIVWGSRTTSTGVDIPIRYHLVVDSKPNDLSRANAYMWAIYYQDESDEDYPDNTSTLTGYTYTQNASGPSMEKNYRAHCVGNPCFEWREELYRGALEENLQGARYSYYDEELVSEWRNLFDTLNEDWKADWEVEVSSTWSGWNPAIYTDPSSINYWLDFIDASGESGDFSVSAIGRRMEVVTDTDVASIINKAYPDILFITPEEIGKYYEDTSGFLSTMIATGQEYMIIQNSHLEYFSISTTGVSCYERIVELVYQHFSYNTQVSITCEPRYYLEPNTLLRVEESRSGVNGDFSISQITIPLSYNGTMNISATQALTKM